MRSLLSSRRFAPLALMALFVCLGFAQKKDEKPASHGEEVEALNLVLNFPEPFAAKRTAETNSDFVANWSGTCGKSPFTLGVRKLPIDQYFIEEPLDVFELELEFRESGEPGFAYDEQKTLSGPFGIAPHAILACHKVQAPGETRTSAIELFVFGLTDKDGYIVGMHFGQMPEAVELESARKFLASGIVWKGKARDPKWTKEEIEARWAKDAPDSLKGELDKVLRTDHYVILTNSSGGKKFAEKMEECYAKIKATYPFDEKPGERLMPVFLFRDAAEYFAFFAKQFKTTVEEARRSKGVAWRDFYATWYEAPNDPVHIHEGTHQIFSNRLRLWGGGSWFQEGVAEYMSTISNDRNIAARTVKKGTQVPLAEFMKVESLLFSSKEQSKSGENEASSQYELAAFLIEFVRESKFSKDHFLEWVHAIGETERNDVPAIEAATKRILGVDLAGFGAQWLEYAKKR
ncbi:MAG TPA: hypothetical protein VM509_12785 [Planctomycetota bacterium]|nr:hypothetical protein [Planctomycetota bacterium]